MKILAAYDASAHADRMLEQLRDRLAWFRDKATLTVAYVHAPLPYPGALAWVGDEVVQKYYSDECRSVLQQTSALLEHRRVPHDVISLIGEPALALVDTARTRGYDLIVMGTHGRGSVMNVVMGSVTTKVLATTTLPVLLFH
jgi:nucleotide-binding universal stress UspA family protein